MAGPFPNLHVANLLPSDSLKPLLTNTYTFYLCSPGPSQGALLGLLGSHMAAKISDLHLLRYGITSPPPSPRMMALFLHLLPSLKNLKISPLCALPSHWLLYYIGYIDNFAYQSKTTGVRVPWCLTHRSVDSHVIWRCKLTQYKHETKPTTTSS